MSVLVSILIPCFNASPWLRKTLESALSQSWSNKEIILVDDGSTDNSLAIAKTLRSREVHIIAQKNQGACKARNVALRASKGEWIQFLDADDLLASDKIERQMALAQAAGAEYAYCCDWTRFIHADIGTKRIDQPLCTDARPVEWLISKFELNAMMHPAAWLISKSLATRAGPWNETLSLDDDGEYFTRVVLSSQGVRFCPEAKSYYRSELPNSLSRSKSEQAWDSAFRSLELSAQRLRQVEDSPRTRHACATAFQRYIYDAYPISLVSQRKAAVHVAALGGSNLQPERGPKFTALSRLIGWRMTRRLQLLTGWL